MKLIINADDLGFSKGINYGIFDAYKNGVVRSSTLMMNMQATDHAIELFKNEAMGIGIHLNITSGKALTGQSVITDEKGVFLAKYDFSDEDMQAIESEFLAQIALAVEKGIEITHFDSHHHIHMWNEKMFTLTKKLASQHKVGIRCNKNYEFMNDELTSDILTPSAFSEYFFDQTVSMTTLFDLVKESIDQDELEIMVHPGFLDGSLKGRDSYRDMRTVEHHLLTSEELIDFLADKGISLIHYGHLI